MTGWRRLSRYAVPLVGLLLFLTVTAVGIVFIDGFGGLDTWRALLLLASFLGIVAAGQTLVIILGGIDLSIPFVVGCANVVAAKLYGDGQPFLLTVLIVLVGAAALGTLNGWISTRFAVHPLLITLGVGTAALGVVQWWTKGFPTGGAPAWLTNFVSIGSSMGPLPFSPLVLLWIGISILLWLLLKRTVFGAQLYAAGSSPIAAEFALVPKRRVWVTTFGLSAVFAACAGILLLGFTGSAYAGVGTPYLFLSIGAVVLGGTMITGGSGGYLGTVFGALILTMLTLVFTGLGWGDPAQQAAMGLVIIVMVALYGRESHVRTRI